MSRLCFNAFNGSPYFGASVSAFKQIEAAAAAGFDLISLDRFTLEAYLAGGGRMSDLARNLARAGIGCGAITAAAMLGDASDNGAALRRAGEWAAELGAPFVQINVAAPPDAQQSAINTACDALAGRVRLAIEYMPFTSLCSVLDTVNLARSAGLERAGALIDVWHHERGPDTWDDLATVPLEAIAYLEFDDALPPQANAAGAAAGPRAAIDWATETLSRRTFPGEGELELPRFATWATQIDYAGIVSVEVLSAPWRRRSFIEFATRAYVASRRYWPRN